MAYKMAASDSPMVSLSNPRIRPSGVFYGDVIIRSEFDMLYYQRVTEITGSLTVAADYGGKTFSLPYLTTVGDLTFNGSGFLEVISLPLLTAVMGDLDIHGNTSFTATSLGTPPLPLLSNVGLINAGAVSIVGNTGLTDAVANSLVAPGSVLILGGWTGAATISGND